MATVKDFGLQKQIKMKKEKSRKSILSFIGEILLWVLALFCVSIALVNIIDTHSGYSLSYIGYRTSVIMSESMAHANPDNTYLNESMNRINKYDTIVAKEVSYDEIKIYDVVLHVESSVLICHRVIDKYESDGVKYLVTRGDANNVDDTPFSYKLFKGKVINTIPKVGKFVLFLQSGYFFLGLCISLFLVCGTLLFISLRNDKKKKKLIDASTDTHEVTNNIDKRNNDE